jgi:hypothetical protein
MEPEALPAPGVAIGLGADQVRAIVDPLVNREKRFRLAYRSRARYRLLLAGHQPKGGPNPDVAVLPALHPEFDAYLGQGIGAPASDDLRELVRQRLTLSNASNHCWDKDVTLEADNITLAFSDRVRTFAWLVESLRITSFPTAQNLLGFLQFLTPDQEGLAGVAGTDTQVKSLIMANSLSSSAQLDASKSSKMYCAGWLDTFRHVYECFCNFRMLVALMVEDLGSPLVLTKLRQYVDLLVDHNGRMFFEVSWNHPHLAVHPWQDIQHILSAFLQVATSANLYQAVADGQDVTIANYATAVAVANGAINDLRAIIHGNGLGKFEGLPCCAPWFLGGAKSFTTVPTGGRDAGPCPPPKEENKCPHLDPNETERKKKMGILTLDPEAAGSRRLPNIPVYFKKRGARAPGRLCMNFLTQGYSCNSKDCHFPHITNVSVLPDAERKKFIDFVKNQPGLNWVEGKAPPGTT